MVRQETPSHLNNCRSAHCNHTQHLSPSVVALRLFSDWCTQVVHFNTCLFGHRCNLFIFLSHFALYNNSFHRVLKNHTNVNRTTKCTTGKRCLFWACSRKSIKLIKCCCYCSGIIYCWFYSFYFFFLILWDIRVTRSSLPEPEIWVRNNVYFGSVRVPAGILLLPLNHLSRAVCRQTYQKLRNTHKRYVIRRRPCREIRHGSMKLDCRNTERIRLIMSL